MENDKTAEAPPAAEHTNGRRPLLEISTLAPDRPYAQIDDVRYDFRLTREFGAVEHQAFSRDIRRYDELWNSDQKLSKADEKEMGQLLERLYAMTLVDPAALRKQLGDRLSGAIKREILLTFTNAPWLMAAAQAETQVEENSSTTES